MVFLPFARGLARALRLDACRPAPYGMRLSWHRTKKILARHVPIIPFPEQNCFNFVLEMEGVAKGDPGEAVSIQAPWATFLWRAE
jgi:hypothetical protein